MTRFDMTPPVPTLEEMAELVDVLPRGPWRSHRYFVESEQGELAVTDDVNNIADGENTALFIAESRAFVPWAIARIRELETELANKKGGAE